ncbi:MAG: TonB-dependent receptor [Pseudomonadota bacterium]
MKRTLSTPNRCIRGAIRPQRYAIATAIAVGTLGTGMPLTPALAQEVSEIEEIIVTARGREENLQDVSIAISAFDIEQLQRRGITELEDVARFTAGFAFEDLEGGAANPSIRGQSTLRGTVAREQTVATFVDGVYMPRNWLVDIGTNNLQRIEIVKGPQSARFGRNAFAGAINYVTQKANTQEMDGNVTLTAGSDELVEFGGSVNFVLQEDVLGVRLSYDNTEFDGTWENDHPNANAGVSPGTDGNVGGRDSDSYSASIVYTPTDDWRFELSYYGAERTEEARATQRLITGDGTGNCGAMQPTFDGGMGGSLFCGEYDFDLDAVIVDPRGFGRQGDSDILRFLASYDINDSINLSYTYGSIKAENLAAGTAESDTVNCAGIITFLGTCNFQGSPAGNVDYYQNELKLTFASDGPWSGAAGLFFMEGEDSSQSYSFNQAPLATDPLGIDNLSNGLPFPASVTALRFANQFTDTTVTAIFGELTYDFSDVMRLSAEARFTDETIRTFAVDDSVLVGDESFTFFTPRVTLEYDLDENRLLYGTVGRGAKAGGFNAGAVSQDLLIFEPEFNVTYEVGSKNVLLDSRLVANAALFLTKWSDQQVNAVDPAGGPFTPALTRNLGDATIFGVEVEGSFIVNDRFSLDGAFSYTDATYDDGTIDALYIRGVGAFPAPCDNVVCSTDGDIGGNDLQNSPELQISLGAQWEDQFANGYSYFLRADVGYQSSYFASQINTAEFPARTVVNARAGANFGQFDVSIWSRNLFDEVYASNGSQIIQPFSNNILGAYFGERRTFGVTATYSF